MLTKKTVLLLSLIFLVWFWIMLWLRGMIFLDPDFGWQLRMGQIILREEIPRTDPFSYTMPSYPYFYPPSFSFLFLAVIYPILGEVGLAALEATLVLAALVIAVGGWDFSGKDMKGRLARSLGVGISFLLAATAIFYYARAQFQMVSWLLLAIFVRIALDDLAWRKWRFALPFLMLVWVNFHGSFVLGLAVIVFALLVRLVRRKVLDKNEVLVLLALFVATLINPYGIGVWREAWITILSSSLRSGIQEWMSPIFSTNYVLFSYLAYSLVLVLRYRRKLKPELMILYFVFLAAGMQSQRHVPLWIVVSLPLSVEAGRCLFREVHRKPGALLRLLKAQAILLLVGLLIFVLQAIQVFRNAYAMSEEVFYPQLAIRHLRSNMPEGEIFSRYGWGGYLIWKLPERRVFVDGRMPVWKWNPSDSYESASAFEESMLIVREGGNFEEVFAKYGVDTVLWPSKTENREKEEQVDFYMRLKSAGWVEEYRDPVAVILHRPE